MAFFKSKISRLIEELSSKTESEAKHAASLLDALLYPNYGPGPRIVSAVESQQISDAHYRKIRASEAMELLFDTARRGSAFARAYALSALGPIGDRRALPVLTEALSDASADVRLKA